MRGVNRCCFLNHTVQPNWHRLDLTRTEQFVDGDHHFLASTHCEHRADEFSTTRDGPRNDVLQLLVRFLARGLVIARGAIGGFDDECLNAREPGVGCIKEPRFLILLVATEHDVVLSIPNVEVDCGGAKDVPSVGEGQLDIGSNVSGFAPVHVDDVLHAGADVFHVVGRSLAFRTADF